MPETPIADRLARIRHRIAEAQAQAGVTQPVSIVAVTKTHGPEAVQAAAEAGLLAVGENRVQEAIAKQDACRDISIAWHLIGPLQGNKVRHAVGRFDLIHSIDRADIAAELSRRTTGGTQQVLIQVNCSGEPQKHGVAPAALPALLEEVVSLGHVAVRGLMTMAALTADRDEQRRAFARLRTLRDQMGARGHALPELSMGMSSDFEVAVEEGATLVRLGTVLFGDRE